MQVLVEPQASEADVQRLRIELRRAESRARSLRRRLEDLGGVRRHGRRSLTEQILEYLTTIEHASRGLAVIVCRYQPARAAEA